MDIGGYNIPKSTVVLVDVFSINNNHKYFEKPDNFDPLRFQDPSLVHKYHRFGLGPRKCMGMYYANHILKSVIA